MRHDAYEVLEKVLANPDPLVRERVVRTLARRGIDALSPPWLALAQDPEPRIRQQVIRTIGLLGA